MHLKFLLIFFLPLCFYAQGPGHSKSERRWAILHPFAAIKVKLISKKCYPIYQQVVRTDAIAGGLDSFSNGGKLDAFRHIFYMAAFAQKVKIKKLRKLGKAHEKTNYKMFLRSCEEFGELPDSLSSVMDLLNNELAFDLCTEIKKLSLTELEQFVIKEIKNGKAFIMKRKKDGRYLDCNDQMIDLKLHRNKWNIPKCLVKSNFIYMD